MRTKAALVALTGLVAAVAAVSGAKAFSVPIHEEITATGLFTPGEDFRSTV